MNVKWLTIIGLFAIFTACVPNRKIVYLQNSKEPAYGEVSNADTVSRKYNTKFREYTLRPRDIISLRIASVTPEEFDFVQKYEEQLGLIRKLNQYDQVNKSAATQRAAGASTENATSALLLDRQQSGFILDDKGNLELPYIGLLTLAGLTMPEAEQLIRSKLKGYFETPVVRLQLLSFHFTILGEVNKEGRYTSFDPNISVIDGFTLAENLTDYADRTKIKIVRTTGNQARVFYLNVLSEDLLGQPGFYLHPNDLIIVPPLKARETKKYTLPAYSTALTTISTTLTLILLLLTFNNN